MRMEIARCLKGEVFPPEEVIRGGDALRDARYGVQDRVCIVVKGSCALLHKGEGEESASLTPVVTLNHGASYGELEVFCHRAWPENHVIRAQQHSDVYHMLGDDFRRIYEQFPVEQVALIRVLRPRIDDYVTSDEVGGINAQLLEASEAILEQAEEEDMIYLTASRNSEAEHKNEGPAVSVVPE